jgi:hypothetical protein
MAINTGDMLNIADDIVYGENKYKDDHGKNKKSKRSSGMVDRGWSKNGDVHIKSGRNVKISDDAIIIY